MYIPAPYDNTNTPEILRFIEQNCFGTLIKRNTTGTPEIRDTPPNKNSDAWPGENMHFTIRRVKKEGQEGQEGQEIVRDVLVRSLPFELNLDASHYLEPTDSTTLTAHMGRHYTMYQSITDDPKGEPAMIQFQGPSTYVSPTWYDVREGATYNYITVNVYGMLSKFGSKNLERLISTQLYRHEKRFRTNPNLSLELVRDRFKYLKEFLGVVQLEVTGMEAAYKLSQDQDEWTLDNIIKHLEGSGYRDSIAIAEQMQQRREIIRRGGV